MNARTHQGPRPIRTLGMRDVMTPAPRTIGVDQTLAVAHRTMRDLGIRHLPVLDHGKLVGVLSQRDLYFIETLKDVDPEVERVADAMTADVYAVAPRDPLPAVVDEMVRRRLGSAIVVDGGEVVGLFTDVDALRLLGDLL